MQTLACLNAQADLKRDYIWPMGYGLSSYSNDDTDSNSVIDFHFSPPKVYSIRNHASFGAVVAMICDTAGNLACSTDGCTFYNKEWHILVDGYQMSPSVWVDDNYCPRNYPLTYSVIILPEPDNPFDCVSFSQGLNYDNINGAASFGLYMSVIDYSNIYNNQLGKVNEKNTLILSDSVFGGHLTACRHANGRDWWIITPRLNSNGYITFLLTNQGLEGPFYQFIGYRTKNAEATGQMVFSADGTKLIRYEISQDLQIFDFDRCTGRLSAPRQFPIAEPWYSVAGGVCTSPSGRYLYVSAYDSIYQFDLNAWNLLATKKTIAAFDSFYIDNFWAANFNKMALGPDGKIYVGCSGGNYYLHVIHDPEEPAAACNFQFRAIRLNHWYWHSLPNIPDYRLGPVEGAVCEPADTIDTIPQPPSPGRFSIKPNPARTAVHIECASKKDYIGELAFFNAFGQLVYREGLFGPLDLQMDGWPAGVYFYRYIKNGERLAEGRLVKVE